MSIITPTCFGEYINFERAFFRDRLGWDVEVTDGQERDHFDYLFPTHIVSITDDGQVASAMLFLQTTGLNMLADVFSTVRQDDPAPCSPLIWEATRFCVDTNFCTPAKLETLSLIL